nr:unnamed protein product [Callosobruchus chinensis]
MAKIDLRDAYFLLAINSNHRKYLRFSFQQKLYQFTCLPFGLNVAPFIFTKLLKPVIRKLRGEGHIYYLLMFGHSVADCARTMRVTLQLFSRLVFIINRQKREHQFSKIKGFTSLIGKLVSVCPTTNYSWLHLKPFEIIKIEVLGRSGNNYHSSMVVPRSLLTEIDWWLHNIHCSGKEILPSSYSLEIYSDTSTTGWGAWCGEKEAKGIWNKEQQSSHINWLELCAAFHALKSFARHRSHCNILLRIDNVTAIACINKMGSTRYSGLDLLTRSIWDWCESKTIHIFASYINTKDNIRADSLSRNTQDNTEFELNQDAFVRVVERFGQPQIDLFASQVNAKCDMYVSWGPDPDSFGVDAFTLDWSDYYFYAFPPFSLINRVVSKIKTDKATGILIAPDWPTQPWYPIFLSLITTDPIEESSLIQTPFPGVREAIRERLRQKSIPEETIPIILASLSDNTLKQYSYCYKKWWNFCSIWNHNPFSFNFDALLRSAFALVRVFNYTSEQQATLKRFFRGIYNKRPAAPRYSATWDPYPVLNYLSTLFPDDTLTLKDLTLKPVTFSTHRLLLTHQRPFHVATTQSISRWVKEILQRSGICLVRKTAGWSDKSTAFNEFYNLPLATNQEEFARCIINTKS